MRTAIYIDGFNLYYGALKNSRYKWLDLRTMVRRVLRPENELLLLKYFTARVKARPGDSGAPERQNAYLRALIAHDPEVEIVYGRFFEVEGSVTVTSGGRERTLYGKKLVEKGTDVSLAVHLLNDAWLNRYDVAVVVSNDTDLAEAIRLARSECRKKVGLIAPLLNGNRDGSPRRMSDALRKATDFQRELRAAALASSQLPNPITTVGEVVLTKPPEW